jgi:prepilin-type N-terminal cleavage/methylation domain-containing protein
MKTPKTSLASQPRAAASGRSSEPSGHPTRASGHESGFTLIEVLVALVLSVLLLIVVYNLFEVNARISRVQTDVAEMQQGQRIAQHDIARIMQMAGRGGVPLGTLPEGMALAVLDSAEEDAHINPDDDATPEVLDGTDVLIVRGVFSAPVYQSPIETGEAITFEGATPGASTSGELTLTSPTRAGIPQDLAAIVEAVQEGRPEALMIVSPISDQLFAVVELDPDASNVEDDPLNPVIAFKITGGTHTDQYLQLTPGGAFPDTLLSYAHIGLLEEYRYYVREVMAGEELVPVLSRARVYPGTQEPWNGDAANWAVDMVDNMFDLQLAIGIDGDGDGAVTDGALEDGGDMVADEWLYNATGDDDEEARWGTGTLMYLRATSLIRSERRDRGYLAPELELVENHDYDGSPLNEDRELWFRRRSVSTTVDLRNAG